MAVGHVAFSECRSSAGSMPFERRPPAAFAALGLYEQIDLQRQQVVGAPRRLREVRALDGLLSALAEAQTVRGAGVPGRSDGTSTLINITRKPT